MSNLLDLYKSLYNDPAKYNEALSHFGAGSIEQIPGESLSQWASDQPDSAGTEKTYSDNTYEGDE